MGQCTAQCKMLLFRARTIARRYSNTELARLKKEEEERRKKNIWPVLRVPGLVPSRYILAPLGVFVMKTLGDEWYVDIKAYKLTVFDILRDFFVLPYIACLRYPYIRVYQLYDSSCISAYANSSFSSAPML